jgi:thiosulfate/3-mercaptopyruvate sulfurtransferase
MMDNPILIVAEVLHARLDNPEWVAVDCRFDLTDPGAGRRNYDHLHVPGAVFLDLDEDLAGPVTPETGRHPLPDSGLIQARLSELGISNSSKVVVYDDSHGALAARAWWILRWLGLDEVYLLNGGFAHWLSRGLPVTSQATVHRQGAFIASPRQELVLTTKELLAETTAIRQLNLLDARDATRFRGEHEPIDPVAGHIPGARNLPFVDFVRRDGTWLPLEDRQALLVDALGSDRNVHWSVMCGSGVTACHLAITGLEAGFREPRLYVGSWSEWIRDSERPIATGTT